MIFDNNSASFLLSSLLLFFLFFYHSSIYLPSNPSARIYKDDEDENRDEDDNREDNDMSATIAKMVVGC